MAFITKIPNRMMYKVFSANSQSSFNMTNFVGGLNNRTVHASANQAMDLLNMKFYDQTVMEKRQGSKLSAYPTSPANITALGEYKPYNDTNQFVQCTDAQIRIGSFTTTLSGRVDIINFQGKLFWTDNYQLFCWGKFPQTGSTIVQIIGTPNPDYIQMAVINPPSGFTPLASPATVGVTVYDYTNNHIYYCPCEDEGKDPYRGSNVLPANPKFIEVLRGRLYVSGNAKDNDNVYLSDSGNPYYFPTALPLQMPPNSDMVKGLCVYDDAVIVGRSEDIHAIHGVTNNPQLNLEMFSIKKLNTHTGFVNNQSVNIAQNLLIYLGNDGNVYSMSASNTNEKIVATTLVNVTVDFSLAPISLVHADFIDACSVYHNDNWYLSVKDKVYVYSFKHSAWTVYNNLNMRSFYKLDETLYWGNDAGQVCTWDDTVFTDNNIPYYAYYTTSWFDMGDMSNFKQYREFYFTAHTFSGFDSDIRIKFEIDYADINTQLVVTNKLSKWGVSKFGDKFITRDINFSTPFVLGYRGRQIRITYQNGYQLERTISLLSDLEDVIPKTEGEMVYVSSVDQYYVFHDSQWILHDFNDLNQPMRIYTINGLYEMRGKR